MNFNKTLLTIYFLGLALAPFVFLLLPANFFDEGQSICLSVLILDTECFGCGITRAIQHLIHLDFESAYNFNKLSFVILPLAVFLWIKELKRVYKNIKSTSQNNSK